MYGRYAPALLDQGWPVIPLRGKRPCVRNWTALSLRMPHAAESIYWQWQYAKANIGLVLGPASECMALDLDVDDGGVCLEVQDLAFRLLGETPLIRIGQPPRRLLIYRGDLAPRKLHPIELLGTGNQAAIYGRHPRTRKPYLWLDREPMDSTPADVPLMNEDQWQAFATACRRYVNKLDRPSIEITFDTEEYRKQRNAKSGRTWYATIADQLAGAAPGNLHNILVSTTAAMAAKGLDESYIRRFVDAHFSAPMTGEYAQVWDQVDGVILSGVKKFQQARRYDRSGK